MSVKRGLVVLIILMLAFSLVGCKLLGEPSIRLVFKPDQVAIDTEDMDREYTLQLRPEMQGLGEIYLDRAEIYVTDFEAQDEELIRGILEGILGSEIDFMTGDKIGIEFPIGTDFYAVGVPDVIIGLLMELLADYLPFEDLEITFSLSQWEDAMGAEFDLFIERVLEVAPEGNPLTVYIEIFFEYELETKSTLSTLEVEFK